MPRPSNEIDADIQRINAELESLEALPTRFSEGGTFVDNGQRIDALRSKLRSLNAERAGTNPMQGPWFQV